MKPNTGRKKSNSALKKNINKNKTLSNTTGLGNYDSNKKMSLFPKVMKMKDKFISSDFNNNNNIFKK